MTLPSASRPLLMCTASLKAAPVTPLRFTRSEPARSTRLNLLSTTMVRTCGTQSSFTL